jgi:hypothetical protein
MSLTRAAAISPQRPVEMETEIIVKSRLEKVAPACQTF